MRIKRPIIAVSLLFHIRKSKKFREESIWTVNAFIHTLGYKTNMAASDVTDHEEPSSSEWSESHCKNK